MPLAPTADVTLTTDQVATLLADQTPALAGLPVTAFTHGWDTVLFRIGDGLLARFPRREAAEPLIRHEIDWLPTLALHVTLPIPQPVLVGQPSSTFDRPWAVVPYVPGVSAATLDPAARTVFAEQLADFLWSLHVPAPAHAPINPVRGGTLARQEPDARARARMAAEPQRDALLARWESWTAAPDHDGVDLWLHGDLHPHNLIVGHDGLLASVVDWGDLTAGDPACDLATAWLTFDAAGRRAFRDRVDLGHPLGEATWTRAKAWALHLGLILAHGNDDDPTLQAVGRHALTELLGEQV